MVSIPTTFSDGSVPTAAQLNGNFAAVGARSIRNADVAADAAIDRSKLAQRFIPGSIYIPAIPFSSGADLDAAPTAFSTIAATWEEINKYYFRVPAGTSMWLAAIDVWVNLATNDPELRFSVDSVVLGASAITVASGQKYSVARTNPFQNPLIPVEDGSVFSVEIQDGSSSTIAGVDLCLHTKMELTS